MPDITDAFAEIGVICWKGLFQTALGQQREGGLLSEEWGRCSIVQLSFF